MKVTGHIVEVGQLEGEDGALGFVIQRPNGEFITVKGLTQAETREVAPVLFDRMEVVVQSAPDAPAAAGAPP